MKYLNLLLIIISLWFCACTSPSPDGQYDLMGNLKSGAYHVGYRTLFVYDQTRPAVPLVDNNGRMLARYPDAPGRQHQINVWYPAKRPGPWQMTFRDYVHQLGLHTHFEKNDSTKAAAEQLYIDGTNSLRGDENFTANDLEKLMDLKTMAYADAKPGSGSFPVVIIPNTRNPTAHSITAEFLASHGYVVVGFNPKGRFSSSFEVSTLGLETAVDDLEFVLNQISRLPYADVSRTSLVANAIYSSVCALAASKNPKIKALISLEGGLPSEFEQRLLSESPGYEPDNLKLPILFIYAPHPSIDPQHTLQLKYSNRYYVHFPNMSEFAMLNYGMFDSFLPDIIGKHEGGTQKGFETANSLMLKFLDIHTKDIREDLFSMVLPGITKEVVDTAFVWSANPAPPNLAEMKYLFLRKGFGAVDSTYRVLKTKGNDQPFSQSFYYTFGMWLGWGNDPDSQYRLRMYQLAYESYPRSASINYYLGIYLQRTGQEAQARQYFQRVLDLLNKTDDDRLSKSERDRLISRSAQALSDLSN